MDISQILDLNLDTLFLDNLRAKDVERLRKEKRKARNEEKKKKEKSRGRRKGVWNLDGSAAPHAMESDKNFRSVVYAAGSENLRPFQRRMCSYFCLAAAVCFHV
jgi:hypothetical protein